MTFFNKKSTFVPYIRGREITVVSNYSALPDPTTVGDKFYWCENSQGTAWLPGSLGGTYYPRGLYYSNGTTWEYMETPIQATQAEVDAGIIDDRFVSPNTLYNADQWNSVKVKLYTNGAFNDDQNKLNLVEGSNMTITDDGAGNITFDATGGGGGDMLKSTYDINDNGIVDKAQSMVTRGRNSTGSTLYKGTIIYLNGATGQLPNFVKARADIEATSAGTFGVVIADIANNSNGWVNTIGLLDGIDTRTSATHPFTDATLAVGQTIYLHPTIAGYVTNVKPSAPDHIVYIGKVINVGPASQGAIVYRIQNGYELEELHNVKISSETNNQVLSYDSTQNVWVNRTLSTDALTVVGNGVIVTGTSDNTFSKALLVPANSYVVNDAPEVIVRVNRTGLMVASFITRLYWNVTPDISGTPILISTLQTTGGGNRFNQFTRTLSIENATSSTFSTGSTNPTDFGFVTPTQVSLAIDWTQNGYLVVSISATSSGDAQCCNLIKIRK
jgi:hypothetical protein